MSGIFRDSFASLTKPGQIRSFDGLRAIAVLLVLVTNICLRTPGISFVYWNTEWTTPLYNGWIGVDLFFVLSGFLIANMVIKGLTDNNFSIIAFYKHRFFRIMPAFFSVILFIVCMRTFFPEQAGKFLFPITGHEVFMNLMFMTDYVSSTISIPSWFLSIEMQFYFILPLLLIFFRKTETRVSIVLFLICSALVFRMITYRTFSIGEAFPQDTMMKLIYFPFHHRMDALFMGVLVALMHYHLSFVDQIIRLVSFYLGLLLVGFIWVSGVLQGGYFNSTIQYSLICFGFGGMLWGILGEKKSGDKIQAFLSHSFWVPMARLSYSVYLTQFLTLAFLSSLFAFQLWMGFFIFTVCMLVALPLYLFIEYPCYQWVIRSKRNRVVIEEPVLGFEGDQIN